MPNNFMLADLWGTAQAVAVFPLFVVIPGYLGGWLLNVFDFRRLRLLAQLSLSVPLSVALCPIVTFLLGYVGGYTAIWIGYGLIWLAFAAVAVLNFRQLSIGSFGWFERFLALIFVVWILLSVGSLLHLQLGNRLYFNTAAFDYCVRSAFTAAVVRGTPPSNPLFAAFGPVALRYHYFWMLMCALPSKLLGVHPLLVMYGGTVWAGVALISMIAVWLRFFSVQAESLRRKVLLALGLLLVTGLDLLPNAYVFLREHRLFRDPDQWNYAAQVSSWTDAMLWVPHYVTALVAGLCGLLLASQAAQSKGARQAGLMIAAGLAFASSAGLGIYVTLVFVVFYVAWLVICVWRKWFVELGVTAGMGAVAVIAALPYLRLLLGVTNSSAGANVAAGSGISSSFLALQVRPFGPVVKEMILQGVHGMRMYNLVDFLCLPLNYFLELGFFFIVACLQLRTVWRRGEPMNREQLANWTLFLASLLMASFVCSTTISNNDLGMRTMLPAQFVLLIWAAPLLNDWLFSGNARNLTNSTRTILAGTLVLGFAATLYQVAVLRTGSILVDRQTSVAKYFGPPEEKLGERALAYRQAFEAIRKGLPADAVVQSNPRASEFDTHDYVLQMIFNDHASSAADTGCGVGFGGDAAKCKQVVGTFQALFDRPGPQDADYVDRVCSAFSTNALVVSDSDAVWHAQTWVWSRPVLYANDHVRVLRCGNGVSGAAGTGQ